MATVPTITSIKQPMIDKASIYPRLRVGNTDLPVAATLNSADRDNLFKTLEEKGETCTMILREPDLRSMQRSYPRRKDIYIRVYVPLGGRQYGDNKQGFYFFGRDEESVEELFNTVKNIVEEHDDGFKFLALQI